MKDPNPMTPTNKSMNEKYGLTKSYQHDLDNNGVCKKCGESVNKLKLKVCPVIGKEETYSWVREYGEIRGDDGGY